MDSPSKGTHYNEVLADGTCFGLFDGSQSPGAISEERFWQYHEEMARREHPAVRGHVVRMGHAEWPRSAIQHARIRTALISTYRVQSRRHFAYGERFPESWPPKEINFVPVHSENLIRRLNPTRRFGT
jgi:hypothetical protein